MFKKVNSTTKNWHIKTIKNSNNWKSPLAPNERKIFISGLLLGMSLGVFIGSFL